MKKFIRYIKTKDIDAQQSLRRKLNDMGFYVLSLPDNILEVNVIEYDEPIENKVLRFFGGRMNSNENPYEKFIRMCTCCEKKTIHVLESSVTVCSECNQTTSEDADELFGTGE